MHIMEIIFKISIDLNMASNLGTFVHARIPLPLQDISWLTLATPFDLLPLHLPSFDQHGLSSFCFELL